MVLLALALLQGNQMQKGDVLRVAQLAGVMGAKHTALLIPLCHNLFLSKVGRPPLKGQGKGVCWDGFSGCLLLITHVTLGFGCFLGCLLLWCMD